MNRLAAFLVAALVFTVPAPATAGDRLGEAINTERTLSIRFPELPLASAIDWLNREGAIPDGYVITLKARKPLTISMNYNQKTWPQILGDIARRYDLTLERKQYAIFVRD